MINSTIGSILQQALSSKTCDLSDLRSDADGYKSALLGGIYFLGRELDDAGAQSKFGKSYGSTDLSELGRFLSCSIELISIMDSLIDGCNEKKQNT
ncbi:hypothetical protein P2H57_00190 [Citrobacter freundii]|uniref:hypothetical protein n=1 Tax=Citrobacter freundii TaxID=546 RepID=UPI0024DE53E0|nr:hypothetical protein [Citrobacter freundii]MDK2357639.1 hypothetical protein [Citrobacter freundii]